MLFKKGEGAPLLKEIPQKSRALLILMNKFHLGAMNVSSKCDSHVYLFEPPPRGCCSKSELFADVQRANVTSEQILGSNGKCRQRQRRGQDKGVVPCWVNYQPQSQASVTDKEAFLVAHEHVVNILDKNWNPS